MELTEKRNIFGAILSILCIVHCVATPFLIASLPSVSVYFASERWHYLIVGLITIVSLPVLLNSASRTIAALSVVGVSVLIGAILLHSEKWEAPVTVIGSLILIAAHILRYRRSQSFPA